MNMPSIFEARAFLVVATTLIGLLVSCTGNIPVPYPYKAAIYLENSDSEAVKVFPFDGQALTIPLPLCLGRAKFGPDGKSLYGTNLTRLQPYITRPSRGLSRIEFNPTRANMVPGTSTFDIKSFAVAVRQDKVVITGGNGRSCGVFEILLPAGTSRQVLAYDCSYRWAWDLLSLSPDGEQAVATVGSYSDHDLHLELIDLVHGTTKPFGSTFLVGVWSPDGKWIAITENRTERIFLIDPHSPSHRRSLGSGTSVPPEWSPDSRYLLIWKYSLFRCGFYVDIEAPATLETLDIETGNRSSIRSSQCQLERGTAGWLSGEIAP